MSRSPSVIKMRRRKSLERQSCRRYVNIKLPGDVDERHGASRFGNGFARGFGKCMHGEVEFLRDSAAGKNLHGFARAQQPCGTERFRIVMAALETRLQHIQIQHFKVDAVRIRESPEFRLSADE